MVGAVLPKHSGLTVPWRIRMTSVLQKVWGHFKNKEANHALGAVQRPGQELCCGQLKAVPMFFLWAVYYICLLTSAQCEPREKSGYKSEGTGERKEQKCPSLAPMERCASVPTAFSAPGGAKCTTPQDSRRRAPSIWTWQHPDATIASSPDLILPLLSLYWVRKWGLGPDFRS